MGESSPAVTVVICTYQRPQLVLLAVRSALTQSLRDLEVLVVVDGRDEETVENLRAIGDGRLRVHVPPRHLGHAGALNAGVAAARGRFVALLDDDDLWLDTKLATQLETAARSTLPYPIVGCRMIARRDTHDEVWPRRVPHPGEPMSEYLFCRTSPFMGEGLINSLTIFAPRDLMSRVPFDETLPRHVDLDWLLRVSQVEGVGLEFVAETEPLAIMQMDEGRPRVTQGRDWRFSLSYARQHRALFTRRSYGAFLLGQVSTIATARRDWRAFVPLLFEACRHGRPVPVDLLLHVANFALSDQTRRRGAALFARRAGRLSVPLNAGRVSP